MKTVPLSRYAIFLALAVGGCAVDLGTKSWIFARLGMPHQQPGIWLIGDIFGLETTLNEGALAGFGQGWTPVFAALSLAAAVGIVYWLFVRGAAVDRLLTASLGCVMAGIFGNLYDRLGLHGLRWVGDRVHEPGSPAYAVRDWLHFKIDAWNFDWPVFNIADCMLVLGAGLLILHAVFFPTPQPGAASGEGQNAPQTAQAQR